jgi:dihydroorotate dehydrogenase electron transfer subunit
MMKHVTIKTKTWLNRDTFSLKVFWPGLAPGPGQFFQLRVADTWDPFLNRPISVASYDRGQLEFIIKVVGRGTHMLSAREPGDGLILQGPFGRAVTPRRQSSLIIAGGIGVAPLYFLAQKLHRTHTDTTFVYGVKRPADFVMRNSIRQSVRRVHFVTETGPQGITAVQAVMRLDLASFKVAYACGPRAMLIALQNLCLKLPIYAFCEDFLGCGCGLCLGCAILYHGEYKRICEDGPVFELKGITFNA